jgi:hypothetical protein
MNDLLDQQDLVEITKVRPKARNRLRRMADVLERAGIYYWVADDGTINTTWSHVHKAGNQAHDTPSRFPDFSTVE